MSHHLRTRPAWALGALGACAAPLPPTVVVVWCDAALAEVRRSRMGPPVVARALAVAHTCMHGAWAPCDLRAAPRPGGDSVPPRGLAALVHGAGLLVRFRRRGALQPGAEPGPPEAQPPPCARR